MNIDEMMTNLLNELESQEISISNDEFLNQLTEAKLNHNNWVHLIEESFKNNDLNSIQVNSNKCSFGHWYNNINIEEENIKEKWINLGKLHKKAHIVFFKFLHNFDNLPLKRKEQIIVDVKDLSNEINIIIEDISEIINQKKTSFIDIKKLT